MGQEDLDRHIGRSDEFMRATELALTEVKATLKEIHSSLVDLPALRKEMDEIKPEVASWVVARKATMWVVGLITFFSAIFTDAVNKLVRFLA